MPPKKKGKRNNGKQIPEKAKRELIYANREELEEYAQVQKVVGGPRVRVLTIDGVEHISTMKGSFHKRRWMKPGELVLVQRRTYQLHMLDIIYTYTNEEAMALYKSGQIPFSFLERDLVDTEEDGVQFDASDEEEDPFQTTAENLAMDLEPTPLDLPPLDDEEESYFNPIAHKKLNSS